ncbi:glycosyltransferase [Sulfurimonas sp.]
MKILVVSSKYQPEYSGSGLRAHNTYKRLEKKYAIEWDVLAGTQVHTKSFEYKYDEKKVNVVASLLSTKPIWLRNQSNKQGIFNKLFGVIYFIFSFIIETLKVFYFLKNKKDSYDIVHTFGDSGVVSATLFWAYIYNKNVIKELTTIRNHSFNVIERVFLPENFKQNIQFIAISPMLEKIVINDGYTKVWQRANPVNLNFFNPINQDKKEQLRKELFLKEHLNKKILLYVAKYVKNKNHKFLLDVMKELDNSYVLYLMGPVDDSSDIVYQNILKEIKNLNLSEKIICKKGFINNFNQYLRGCDIYIFPSLYEGFGTQIVESICCNVAIVSNKLENITEHYIQNGVNGYESYLDSNEFSAKIKMIDDIDYHKLNDINGRIRTEVNTEVIDAKYFEIMKGLVNVKYP